MTGILQIASCETRLLLISKFSILNLSLALDNFVRAAIKPDGVPRPQLLAPHGADLAVDSDFLVENEVLRHAAGFHGIGQLEKALQLDKLGDDGHVYGAGDDPSDSYFHGFTCFSVIIRR